ncbi:MAG: NUDIX domain-containing protein [Candidatus Marsarchaeota archaeon]|jgi:8-oxo-dGTP pyrophosphatase MutT (NUDIX family)|nr:NUDIX domain-containing protein [Candidatus Marsarchaeota archaeon]MCL5430959.1 NUDIX domain-containing protein [Candidatus Marsarchaeota archaeon]
MEKYNFVLKAMLICKHDGKFLMQWAGKSRRLMRPLGGHVEMYERSDQTIKREIREEIKSGISNLRYLGAMENIFVSKGKREHEVCFIYSGEITNRKLFGKDIIYRSEDGRDEEAMWISEAKLRGMRQRIVPKGVDRYIFGAEKARTKRTK